MQFIPVVSTLVLSTLGLLAAGKDSWEVSFSGVACRELDTAPFRSLEQKWPKCHAKATEKALKVAETENCRLCDVRLHGGAPEPQQEQGMFALFVPFVTLVLLTELGIFVLFRALEG